MPPEADVWLIKLAAWYVQGREILARCMIGFPSPVAQNKLYN
jgi:hypothetical protein